MTFDPTIRTMAFVVALALLVSIVSGLVPALKVTSVNLNGALHAHGRGSAAGGFGSVGRVLVVEVALSVALLNCALVTARALASYIDDIPALPKGQVLTARLSGERIERDPRSPAGGDSRVSRGRIGRRRQPSASARSHRRADRDRIARRPIASTDRLGAGD